MSQSLVKNIIHIIYSTKGRYPFLEDAGIRGEMHAFLKSACDKMACPALKVGGAMDHVHLLCHLSKNVTGAKLVGEIKRSSSVWMKSKGPAFIDFYWQGGYAYFSVSPKDTESVIHYIGNQMNHHKQHSFKDELTLFLKKYGVEYAEEYLWD